MRALGQSCRSYPQCAGSLARNPAPVSTPPSISSPQCRGNPSDRPHAGRSCLYSQQTRSDRKCSEWPVFSYAQVPGIPEGRRRGATTCEEPPFDPRCPYFEGIHLRRHRRLESPLGIRSLPGSWPRGRLSTFPSDQRPGMFQQSGCEAGVWGGLTVSFLRERPGPNRPSKLAFVIRYESR